MIRLSTKNLGLRRDGAWALRGISFDLRAGEALGIVGESGAGKTTLLDLCLGLLDPDEGEVRLGGEPWSARTERERRLLRPRIQAVFQDALASLPPHLTGWEVLLEPLNVWRRDGGEARREAARRMAAKVGFPEAALDQRRSAWSGGMAQRLALARALMLGPGVLALDEPLAALDPAASGRLLDLLIALKAEGLALLFVSHDLPAAARLCDRLLVLYGGEAMDQGPTTTILDARRHPYLRALWDATPSQEPGWIPQRWGTRILRPKAHGGCVLLDRCPRAQDACHRAPAFIQGLRCHDPFDE